MVVTLERVLCRHAEWRRETARSAVDLLRVQWGATFAIWWEDGWYWAARRGDGTHRAEATAEELNRYMAGKFAGVRTT
jgi:predicted phage tail protein